MDVSKIARRRTLALAVLPLLLTSCAVRQPKSAPMVEPTPVESPVAVESPPPADYGPLYARIADLVSLYAEGIELIAAGEEVPGEERIVTATNGLLRDGETCAASAGCDVGRLFDAFDRLLTEQGIVLKRQALRVAELENSALEDVEREPGTSPFSASIPALAQTSSLLRGTELREIIRLNGPVRAAIDDWLTWMRPMLMEAYENYQFLRPRIAPIYEEAGLPEALLFAMIATESGGKVHSFSRAGAAGPLQFMRMTGRRYGLGVDDGFDMRLDPEAATRANVAYLNDQFEALNGSLELALAAYNGGESRVSRLSQRHGSNLWDGKVYYALPGETREYVPRILAAAWLFLHPEEYNLEFPAIDTATTRLTVREAIAINELTVCLGQEYNAEGWFRVLRNLNPRLSPGERIEAGGTIEIPAILAPVYERRCLEGQLIARARELHEANYPPEPEMIPYTVRRGDTLGRIASRFRCASVGEIADINRIRAPRYVIREGQTLRIPSCD